MTLIDLNIMFIVVGVIMYAVTRLAEEWEEYKDRKKTLDKKGG